MFKKINNIIMSLFLAFAVSGLLTPFTVHAEEQEEIEIQVIHFSDWHAFLEPSFFFGTNAGGAAELSAAFEYFKSQNPNTLIFQTGDAFNASPPLSGQFEEEPAIGSLNLMGVDAIGIGNHEFDRSIDHLNRMTKLADFRFLAHNIEYANANVYPKLKGVQTLNLNSGQGNFKVGLVGITTQSINRLAPDDVTSAIEVTEILPAAQDGLDELFERSVDLKIALVHEGAFFHDGVLRGIPVDIANNAPGYDLILTDQSVSLYAEDVNNARLIDSFTHGQIFTVTTLRFDAESKALLSKETKAYSPVTFFGSNSVDLFEVTFSNGEIDGFLFTGVNLNPDQEIVDFLQPFKDQLEILLKVVIAESPDPLIGNIDLLLKETKLGNAIADAMRRAVEKRTNSPVTLAYEPVGGIRDDLTCPGDDNSICPAFTPPPHLITRGQVFSAVPFVTDDLVYVDITGPELKAILENAIFDPPFPSNIFAQISGLCVTYDIQVDPFSFQRVQSAVRQASDGSCDASQPIDFSEPSQQYRVVTNSFVAQGGDFYPDFSGRFVTLGNFQAEVAKDIEQEGFIDPQLEGRIQCIDSDPNSGDSCP